MGCCQSKSNGFSHEQDAIPQNPIHNNINRQNVPPIIITKAHSIASVDSSLPQSTSVGAVASDTKKSVPLEHNAIQNGSAADAENMSEKPSVIIEERTQVHDYGVPPDLREHNNEQATIRQVKPIVINSPQSMSEPTIVPASDIPQAKAAAVEAGILAPSSNESTPLEPSTSTAAWSILIRRNSSSFKDTAIEIPTVEPFMTVSDVKRKIHVEPGQQIKLIHLGKILKDNATLVPSFCSKSLLKQNAVRVANHGVIQAMVYTK
ncbi:uncharacterized protein ATC70_007243 [Mucor velutinosus]|uniref:Ubiquitin-like domain-containing protein n=1 Tax=Mucor velutinosus TaxID=708070 RepID=A0AAN7HRD8_9FUNG|nr:hypothetical protein ATC70_007243 [Mucor velutinosus]